MVENKKAICPPERERVLILGAAGRDFHNFNVCFRDNPDYEVIAFTAAQIPGIENRRYPPELSGPLYPDGIPIYPEEEMAELVRANQVRQVIFAYSDVSHVALMHLASRALAAGADFRLIGPRGRAPIDIDDDGRVDIASIYESAAQKAVEIIRELTAEAELGKMYVGKVVRVVTFGAFVEILPGVEGLLHISEIADQRIREVRDEINDGDEILVKVIDIDPQGRVRLSRKAAMKEAAAKEGKKQTT